MDDFIHINPRNIETSSKVLLLIIPILLFILVAALLFSRSDKEFQMAATSETETAVLGEEIEIEK